MKSFSRTLFLIGALGCILLVHFLFRYHTASLFLAPATTAILLASITPPPVVLVVIIGLLFELVSTLPFGAVLVLFAIPFIVHWALRFPATDFSWKFFCMGLLSAALQIIFLVTIKSIFHPLSFVGIPWEIMGFQIVCTGIFAYAISAFYHEFSSRI